MAITAQKIEDRVVVSRYTRGVIGPSLEMTQVVRDGGRISTISPPGCWGPMISPNFEGGHEVSWPVAVQGAEIGDAIAITIEKVEVLSEATSSGTMRTKPTHFGSDPFVDKKCPGCGTPWPNYKLSGTGSNSVRCAKCGAEASPFDFEEGYTIVFDKDLENGTTIGVGITVNRSAAHEIAKRARDAAKLPEGSEQIPILTYEAHEIPGTVSRLRSFIGNIGTIPSKDMPDSHNAGDFGSFLIGANHKYAMTEEELMFHKTDGHLDCDSVRPGSVLIVPVKVDGGGIYIGDAHANMGDGELALHTTDITADVEVKVDVIKDMKIDGPILLPVAEDLPWIGRPFTEAEKEHARKLAGKYGIDLTENVAPVQIIGSGKTINEATDNAIKRASQILKMSIAEVRNRSTITGAVEISRLPGVVQLTLLVPMRKLESIGIADYVRKQYKLHET